MARGRLEGLLPLPFGGAGVSVSDLRGQRMADPIERRCAYRAMHCERGWPWLPGALVCGRAYAEIEGKASPWPVSWLQPELGLVCGRELGGGAAASVTVLKRGIVDP